MGEDTRNHSSLSDQPMPEEKDSDRPNSRVPADDSNVTPSPSPRQDASNGAASEDSEEVEFGYRIVEPPEGDEDDGFDNIPAGPTEEVRFGEGPLQRGRRRHPRRPKREPRPTPKPPRFPLWAALVALAVVVIVILLILWLAVFRQSEHEAQSRRRLLDGNFCGACPCNPMNTPRAVALPAAPGKSRKGLDSSAEVV